MFKWFKNAKDNLYYRLNLKTNELEPEDEIEDMYGSGYSVWSLVLVGALASIVSILGTWCAISLNSAPKFVAGVHLLERTGHHKEAIALGQLEGTCANSALLPSCAQTLLHGIDPELANALAFVKR